MCVCVVCVYDMVRMGRVGCESGVDYWCRHVGGVDIVCIVVI